MHSLLLSQSNEQTANILRSVCSFLFYFWTIDTIWTIFKRLATTNHQFVLIVSFVAFMFEFWMDCSIVWPQKWFRCEKATKNKGPKGLIFHNEFEEVDLFHFKYFLKHSLPEKEFNKSIWSVVVFARNRKPKWIGVRHIRPFDCNRKHKTEQIDRLERDPSQFNGKCDMVLNMYFSVRFNGININKRRSLKSNEKRKTEKKNGSSTC